MKIGNIEGFVQTNESKVLETNKFSMALTSKAFDAVISTLYSDRIMAVVREYSTNAYEAHQYSDIEHIPFDVICPTSSNPTFVVRDYGPGMSRDKISLEYTKVFESDKCLTNKYSGGMGLGSKVGFCYVPKNQKFLTISYYEGKKNTYECYRGSDGIPIMDLVKVEYTEETGVEIRIPVSTYDISKFESAIHNCYMYFRTIPNIENTEVKPYVKTLTELETNEYSFTTNFYKARCRIGNITYEIRDSKLPKGTLVEIPIGDVTIESSREGLSYDNKTISYLNNLSIRIVTEIRSKINGLVSKSNCLYEAAIIRNKYCGVYSGDILFNDRKIATRVELTSSKVREFAYSKLSTARNVVSYYSDIIFVVKDCGSIANRIKQYCYDKKLSTATFVTIEKEDVESAIIELGITKDYLVNLSTFKAPKATARAKAVKIETINVMNVANYIYEPIDKKNVAGLYLLKGKGEDFGYNDPDTVRSLVKILDIKDSVYLVTNSDLKLIKSSNFSNLYTIYKDNIAELINSKEMVDYKSQQILIRKMRYLDIYSYFMLTVGNGSKSFIPFFDSIGTVASQPSYYNTITKFDSLMKPIDETIHGVALDEIIAKYPLITLCRYDCGDAILSDFVNYVKGKNEAGN